MEKNFTIKKIITILYFLLNNNLNILYYNNLENIYN